jgi:hypothetical protein
MDERIYTLLLIFSGALMLGMLWAVVRFICGRPETDMDRFQFWILGLLAVELLGVLFSYFWYNTKFVQHQGRYLFWGMLPLATFSALGWRELLHPLQAKVTGLLLATLAVALTGVALFSGSGDKLVIVAIGAGALLLLSVPLLQVGVVSADILALPHWLHRLMLTPWIQRLLGPLRFAAAPPILRRSLCCWSSSRLSSPVHSGTSGIPSVFTPASPSAASPLAAKLVPKRCSG